MKKVIWHPKALEMVQEFPKEAKKEMGYLIFRLQQEERLWMPFSRPMKLVGNGVQELRVRRARGAYRAFYFLKLDEGILIFHAFGKKSQKTPRKEIEVGIQRLTELLDA